MVPDITGGAMCIPRVPELPHTPDPILPCTSLHQPLGPPPEDKPEEQEEPEEEAHPELEEDEPDASRSEKRLSTESGYGASERLLDVVEMRDQEKSPIPPDQLSLPPVQTDTKVTNRDSGIDSISSPSHSEELCFVADEREVCLSLPRLSSSCTCMEGPTGQGAACAAEERGRDSDGDSDLEEGSGDESENVVMAMQSQPKAERQDSVEVG